VTVPPMSYDEFVLLGKVPENGRPFRIGNGQLAGLTHRSQFFEDENRDILRAVLHELGPGTQLANVLHHVMEMRAKRGIPAPKVSEAHRLERMEAGI